MKPLETPNLCLICGLMNIKFIRISFISGNHAWTVTKQQKRICSYSLTRDSTSGCSRVDKETPWVRPHWGLRISLKISSGLSFLVKERSEKGSINVTQQKHQNYIYSTTVQASGRMNYSRIQHNEQREQHILTKTFPSLFNACLTIIFVT